MWIYSFNLDNPNEDHTLVFSKEGYNSKTVTALKLEIALTVTPTEATITTMTPDVYVTSYYCNSENAVVTENGETVNFEVNGGTELGYQYLVYTNEPLVNHEYLFESVGYANTVTVDALAQTVYIDVTPQDINADSSIDTVLTITDTNINPEDITVRLVGDYGDAEITKLTNTTYRVTATEGAVIEGGVVFSYNEVDITTVPFTKAV